LFPLSTICPGPIKIKDGDYMSINSRYDQIKHPLRIKADHKEAEVMGMWTMNFIDGTPSKSATPAPATADDQISAAVEDDDE